MSTLKHFKALGLLTASLALGGCAVTPPKPYDYTAFKAAKPATILVLPPLNETTDIKATYGVMAQASVPLAESGYYVYPVTLVDETFKQNGYTQAADIHAIGVDKLRAVFGSDAALYIQVKRYGTSYAVVASETVVGLNARLVDLRTGQLLWEGAASASSAETQNNSQGGLVGLLVKAIVEQIINTAADTSFTISGVANQRLMSVHRVNGLLPGPRLEVRK